MANNEFAPVTSGVMAFAQRKRREGRRSSGPPCAHAAPALALAESKMTGAQHRERERENAMKIRYLLIRNVLLASAAGAAFLAGASFSPATAQGSAALVGQVSSAEEGAMEGVVVSAKKDGSTITVSVVT